MSLIGLALLGACSGDDGPSATPEVSSSTPTLEATEIAKAPEEPATPTVPDVPVAEIEQILASGDGDLILDLVGAPAEADIDPAALSEITELLVGAELDPDGIAPFGDGVVTIPAVVDGRAWLFYLVLHNGEWKLALTEETP